MKNRNGFKIGLLSVALLAVAGAFSLGTTGCVSTQTVSTATNAVTGEVSSVTNVSTKVDPARLDQVEAALEPVVASAARRVLGNSPKHSDEIALYLRSVGQVFCDMESSGTFDPEYLIRATDGIVSPMLSNGDVIDVKNAAIAIYKIAWNDRFRAELPAPAWTGEACKLICGSINTALKDAGKGGL